jgi:hypothetical protein
MRLGAYNRAEYLPERKRLMQYWADYLETQRGKVVDARACCVGDGCLNSSFSYSDASLASNCFHARAYSKSDLPSSEENPSCNS